MASKNILCLRCDEPATRVKRRLIDRLVSLFKPVKRYRCDYCDWEATIEPGPAGQPNKK